MLTSFRLCCCHWATCSLCVRPDLLPAVGSDLRLHAEPKLRTAWRANQRSEPDRFESKAAFVLLGVSGGNPDQTASERLRVNYRWQSHSLERRHASESCMACAYIYTGVDNCVSPLELPPSIHLIIFMERGQSANVHWLAQPKV